MHRGIFRGLSNFGWLKVVKHYAIEVVNKITYFKIYRVMMIDQPNPKWMALDSKYTCRFLDAHEVLAYSRHQEFELSEDFVQKALSKGDRCCAILDGDFLASYGWYSTYATLISPQLQITCSPDYTYMYHGYTHSYYRGRRFHAIRATHGLVENLRRGVKGLIFYVEENNYRSLQSATRLNSQIFGRVFIIKIFGKYIIYHSSGCQTYRLRINIV